MSEETILNPAIHAAFRRDLRRFRQAFDAFDAQDETRARQLVAAWANFFYQLDRHHRDEESFFWPAFRELGVDGAIIDSLLGEHEVMVAALGSANAAMRDFGRERSAASAKTAELAVTELECILADHLAHEERDLDPFSIETKNTRQHKQAETAARKAHTEGVGMFFSWLTDDADPQAAQIIGREIPGPVLWLLTHVGGRAYRRDIAAAWR